MKFVFKAKDKQGQVREGMVESTDAKAAALILERNELVPISLKEEKEISSLFKGVHKIWEGVKQKELMVFFQQFSTLISAHVPVVSALRTIEEQVDNKYFKIIIKEMADDVEDGLQFSSSLEKHPDVFSPLTINMIRAGEVSGKLQQSIDVVSQNIEKNYQLTSKIKGALYYPAFVITVAIIIGFLVVTFILPRITVMIKDLKVPVPWYTSFLMWLGDFMSVYWWAVLMAMMAMVGGVLYYAQTPMGRREWQQLLLKIPVTGALARSIYITRFSENLGALLDSGIPVVKALSITSQVVGNITYERIILKAGEEVKTGGTMSTVLLKSKEFPPIVAQMVRIGEETGSLAKVLQSVAKFYNQEVETTTRSLTSLIEPILIIFLGIGVGIMVVGVLLPIYNIASQL